MPTNDILATVAAQREAAARARAELRGEAYVPPVVSYPSPTAPAVSEKLLSGQAQTVTEARAIVGYEQAGYTVERDLTTGGLMVSKPVEQVSAAAAAVAAETPWHRVTSPQEAVQAASLLSGKYISAGYVPAAGGLEKRILPTGETEYRMVSKEADIREQVEKEWTALSPKQQASWKERAASGYKGHEMMGAAGDPKEQERLAKEVEVEFRLAETGGVPILDVFGYEVKGTLPVYKVASALRSPAFTLAGATLLGAGFRAATAVGVGAKAMALPTVKGLLAGTTILGGIGRIAETKSLMEKGKYTEAKGKILETGFELGGFLLGWKLAEPKPLYKVKQPIGVEIEREIISEKEPKAFQMEKKITPEYMEYIVKEKPEIYVPEELRMKFATQRAVVMPEGAKGFAQYGRATYDVATGKMKYAPVKTLKTFTEEWMVPAGKRVFAEKQIFDMSGVYPDITPAAFKPATFISAGARTKLVSVPGLAVAGVEKIVVVRKVPFLPVMKVTTATKMAEPDLARITATIMPTIVVGKKEKPAPVVERVPAKLPAALTIISAPLMAEFSRVGKLKPIVPEPPVVKPELPAFDELVAPKPRVVRLEARERVKYEKLSKAQLREMRMRQSLLEQTGAYALMPKRMQARTQKQEQEQWERVIGLQAQGVAVDTGMDQFIAQQMGRKTIYGQRLRQPGQLAMLGPEWIGTMPTRRPPVRVPGFGFDFGDITGLPGRRRGAPGRRAKYEEKVHPGDIMRAIGGLPAPKRKRGRGGLFGGLEGLV